MCDPHTCTSLSKSIYLDRTDSHREEYFGGDPTPLHCVSALRFPEHSETVHGDGLRPGESHDDDRDSVWMGPSV